MLLFPAVAAAQETPQDLRGQATQALRRSVEFYTRHVAAHGGYGYRASADLARREGEGKIGTDTVWVQPPGTPAVGLAYVEAWQRTREPSLLVAASAAAECLLKGQLRSGGWTDRIEFAPAARAKFDYRVDPPGGKRRFNWTTFDDDKTQSAVRFLMRLDQALEFRDAALHEAVEYALTAIVKAQSAGGGWPQGFMEPAAAQPVKNASYPAEWPRQHPGGDYWVWYTFNDNSAADTIEMLLLAAEIYSKPEYREAAIRGGEFIVRAQMPAPQPAWAQQYNFEMQPVWARKFEPPAISGSESQGLIETLQRLYIETGERKFLAAAGPAIAYLEKSRLPDGRLARFYELQTNKPLYLNRKYELTFEDNDLPTHYGFKVSSRLERLAREQSRLEQATDADRLKLRKQLQAPDAGQPSDAEVRRVIGALDERGAWVEDGRLKYYGPDDDTRRIIDNATFIRHLGVLSRWLAAHGPVPPSQPK